MLKVGLTGGIGSGKSTVAQWLAQAGVPVLEADQVARELLERDPELRAALCAWLGPRAYGSDGSLNRAWIAERVFSDREALARLNSLVHPRVLERARAWIRERALEGQRIAVVVAALLVESGLARELDRLVVVAADEAERIRRVMVRDGVDEEAVRARMRHQRPQEALIREADYVLWNTGTLQALRTATERLLAWLRAQLSDQVREAASGSS
ncbi:MAG: dephospho-CoA kinase [Bacteroidota bacterium]|nr:dephospho-CoA kinase [Rhodothermia bacterium]MCS7155587.1 dephospho-CoA kinase [Bacteroidota bacterium]MDW8137273.1 dephospho-CoA kinase [Bacteroidota bacterium]MDW8284857.1 dephospho-CoA kinase [Bacteroidota bacterium]